MHIHILGICGTFMGSLALIARQAGHHVTGSDQAVYPPMSDMLAAQGIGVLDGYLPEHLEPAPDCVVIGNALSRGNPAVEYVLDRGIDYRSGPQWLAESVLRDKRRPRRRPPRSAGPRCARSTGRSGSGPTTSRRTGSRTIGWVTRRTTSTKCSTAISME